MRIIVTIPPASEPVALTEVKKHLRLATTTVAAEAYTTEDDLLNRLIMTARIQVEQETGRALITQTRTLYLDAWPNKNYINLPYPTLQSVVITYWLNTDTGYDNTLSTVDADIVSEPGRVILQPDESWPSGSLYTDKPVKVEFVCGYGDVAAAVPASIRSAILLKISDLYENRGEVVMGVSVSRIQNAVDSLLRSFCIHTRFE
ncbi:MAG: hypothetical protein PF495_12835 [Spirochaetales bacterium]|jgi:uncharacterized phiE125 gp8 family phage protein|nr:hypothetical protein [Spirochaetales bacterium]